MITDIRISRFKNLQDLSCKLGRVTVLVGANNAGKSSVLQGLQFANSVAQSLKLDGVSRWSGTTTSGTLATEQLVYTPFRDIDALSHGGHLAQNDSTAIVIEMRDEEDNVCETRVRRGKNKNLSVTLKGRQLGKKLEPLEEPFSILTPGLAGIPAQEEFRSEGIVRRAAAKGDANSVLRNILWILKQNRPDWKEFCQRFQMVFPSHSIDVRFHPAQDETITAHVEKAGIKLPLDACGTGVLQVVQILAYVGVYHPQLLLLDEPDSHLHPANQRVLGKLLADLAEELEFQILISTHSRHLLDELTGLGATLCWVDNGAIRAEEYDNIEVLLDLGALDAGDRLRNGLTPWVLLTEDSKPENVSTLVASNGISSDQLAVWSYKGCTRVDSAVMLAEFIRQQAPGTRVIVHRDRDYLDDKAVSDFEKQVRTAGLIPFVTEGTDVESHFLNADYLGTVLQGLTAEDAHSLIDEALASAADESLSLFAKTRFEQASASRRSEGKTGYPDIVAITRACEAELMKDRRRFTHGKKALKNFRRLAQDRYKVPRFRFGPSAYLRIESLYEDLSAAGNQLASE